MKIRFATATALFALLAINTATAADVIFVEPTPAPMSAAERLMVLEAEVLGGYTWRGGNAINEGGGSSEDEDFAMLGGGFLAAIPLGQSWLIQGELDGEYAFSNDGDDNYGGILEGGGHVAWAGDRYLFGAFGGLGTVEVDDQANFAFGGLEARMNFSNSSFAVQGGYLAGESEDDEVLDNAYFVRGIAQHFVNDGRTKFQGDLMYIMGEQDTDGTPDDMDVIAWGLEVEHAPDIRFGSSALSVFAAYEGHHMIEDSDSGSEDKLTDHTVMAGIRIRFGAATPAERARATAPDLPGFGRLIGATPAVD